MTRYISIAVRVPDDFPDVLAGQVAEAAQDWVIENGYLDNEIENGALDDEEAGAGDPAAGEANRRRAFYRNVIAAEILSDEPLPDRMALADMDYLITEGHCSGQLVHVVFNEEVSAGRMRSLLVEQGSEPSFLVPGEEADDEQSGQAPRPGIGPRAARPVHDQPGDEMGVP